MSQHFLATLFVVISLVAVGLFGLAMVLAWRDRQTALQRELEHQRRLTALRQYHRNTERRIDQITVAAIERMVTMALKGDQQ